MESTSPNLPPYTYVPGHAPHPVSDPEGHMHGQDEPTGWTDRDYLRWGKHLFEHGYYWEAHEAWEHLWLQLGRTSADALIVKGLIKLAASGVKCREGNSAGAVRHAKRALELLSAFSESPLFADINLSLARDSASLIAHEPPVNFAAPSGVAVSLPDLRVSQD